MSETGPRTVIVLGGGVREALMAQSVIRVCEGATVFASGDAIGTLIGVPAVGRSVIFDDSPSQLWQLFKRLRTGGFTTAVVPFPARPAHATLVYFAGIPRRLVFPNASRWAATEPTPGLEGLHPVEANWRLALISNRRPMQAMSEPPRLQPAEAVRKQALARWSSFLGGARPLILIPGGGGWSRARPDPCWPAERFAVVANQSAAERIMLFNGAGDERMVRETRAGIVKPTAVVNVADLTVEELAAISELSYAVLGHDGDALHCAAAAGALVLAIGRQPDIPPLGERVVNCWVDDYNRYPARQVLEALSAQARVDTYA